jgi:hypothetical protein
MRVILGRSWRPALTDGFLAGRKADADMDMLRERFARILEHGAQVLGSGLEPFFPSHVARSVASNDAFKQAA